MDKIFGHSAIIARFIGTGACLNYFILCKSFGSGMWKACFILVLCLASVLVVCARARPQDKKSRVVEGRLSDEKHFEGEEHNVEYDHEAFLGKDKKTFDQLSTEESVERLG